MAKRVSKPSTPADPRWGGDQFWYRAKVGEPVHDKVVTYGTALRGLYSSAHARDRVHERIYDGAELRRFANAIQALQSRGFSAARLNASKAVVNTVVSRLSKNRPMPSFVVDDADWSLKRKAKQYRKFILGEMMQTDFDARSKEALLDGAIVGAGLTRIDDTGDGEKVFAERVLCEEWLYDPRECRYGKPQQAILIRRYARAHLADLFPEHAARIYNAPPSQLRPQENLDDDLTSAQDLDDYVDAFEAWHLPRRDDGRRVLCIDGATLISEQWHEERFPVATFRYQKPRRGVWGRGLIHELKDLQHRINCIVRDMQMNLQATGRGAYVMSEADAIPAELLTGLQPFTIKYKGNRPPVWTAPTPINPAQLEMLQFFMQQMFEISGVSQAAAASRSSLGAGASGVALDTQYDIESERFAMQEAQYAEYRLDAAQLYIDASKRVARKRAEGKDEKRKPYVSGWLGRDAIEKLEHDKVSLESDDYRLQLEAVNFIPDTRAGKLSAVGQLAQAGVIPQWLSAALFDEPDLQRGAKITLAAFHNCERKMETCADPDKPMPAPAPYNDLQLELTMCTAYLNNAEAENAPAEVIERYLQYLSLVEDLIAKKAPPAPAVDPAMAAAGGPGIVPGVGQTVPPMSGGAMPPEMMPPLAA